MIGIAGPVLFSGYWPDGGGPDGGGRHAGDSGSERWFWTSDLGQIGADGRLAVRGRADDVINSGGEKVVPGEVETVLGTIAGVRDVVVVGVADQEWGEAVTAVIVPADGAAPPELGWLREQVRERLPGYAAPRRMVFVAQIPMLSFREAGPAGAARRSPAGAHKSHGYGK